MINSDRRLVYSSEKYLVNLSILFLFALSFNSCALSKRPSEIYKVQGSIVSHDESYKDIPVKQASVSVFFDEFDYGYSGYTSDDGEYQIKCRYNTYSGRTFFRDLCGKKPRLLTIVVHKDDNFAKRITFKIGSLNFLKEDNKFILPSIRIISIGNTFKWSN